VLGGRIRKFGGDLECRLAEVRTMADETPAHHARIAATRLRYLLEPIRNEVPGVEPLIVKLRSLQDELGDLHDSQTHRAELGRELAKARRVHAQRLDDAVRTASLPATNEDDAGADPRPGLLAVIERLEEREREAFAQLRADWLAGAADQFFEAVTTVGKQIANRPACVAEIERRFLLRRVPATAQAFATQEIEQGWLPGTRVVERIRRLRVPDQPVTYRSAKSATGALPAAPDGEVDEALFASIWPLTEGRRVVRRRHVVADYGLAWEIDQFLDRDLVMAEVAVPEDAPVVVPEWLERYVVREVTGEREYTNRALAR
jgi:CYTH domain-containing protein